MLQIVNLMLFVLGLVSVVVGLAKGLDAPPFLFLAVLGFALGVLAYISDERRKERAEARRLTEAALRIAELTAGRWPSDRTFKVRASVGTMLLSLCFTGASALAIYVGVTGYTISWPMVLPGALFLAISVLTLPTTVGGLIGSACEMDHEGFSTPTNRKIPWRAVTAVNLQVMTYRGITYRSLLFCVENYRRVAASIHWTDRVWAVFGTGPARNGRVSVPLRDRREQPEVAYAVARFLWMQDRIQEKLQCREWGNSRN